jgi:hypothetical protein
MIKSSCCAILAVACVGFGTPLQASATLQGNGGFYTQIGYLANPPTKVTFVDVDVDCEYGYTCGLTNVEVDWDDGTALDSFVGYLPIEELGFEHEYAQNGLYHVEVSADDDMGNWLLWTGLDVTIFY